MRIPYTPSLASLQAQESHFLPFFTHGTMSIELYKPREIDPQQPHEQDELYVIMAGKGRFELADMVYDFEANDMFFVPAGAVHRFVDFSADFVTWVIFYGAKGGEQAQ